MKRAILTALVAGWLAVPGVATAYDCVVTWEAATDNVGVAGYRGFVNGAQAFDVAGLTATVPGADCPIGAEVAVAAYDAAGNVSAPSDPVLVVDDQAPTVPGGTRVRVVVTVEIEGP